MVSWPSGLRRTPGKRVGGNPSGVRIPPTPPCLLCFRYYPVHQFLILRVSNPRRIYGCEQRLWRCSLGSNPLWCRHVYCDDNSFICLNFGWHIKKTANFEAVFRYLISRPITRPGRWHCFWWRFRHLKRRRWRRRLRQCGLLFGFVRC